MKRDIVRFGIILVLVLSVISGCTRAKSSEPAAPTSTGSGEPAATQPPGAEPSATSGGSAQDDIAATTTAWARETAAAATTAPGETETAPTEATEAPPEGTSEPETTPEPTEPGATEEPEATQAPEPTSDVYPTALPEPPPGEERTHTVQSGENLFRIALSYGLSTQTLASYNGIANPNHVYVGQVLRIPPTDGPVQPLPPETGYHTVRSGENLFRIALQYNMSYITLANANGLPYPYTIYVGQRLIIP